MNNQQFIFMVFGSISLLLFTVMAIAARVENYQKKKRREATAEPESHPRSAE
jgi:hypothetical protein